MSLVPYSSTDSESNMDDNAFEEETCVGKRGYKKKTKKNLRSNCTQKCVQPNPCLIKKCGNDCAANFSEDDREAIFENYWGMSKNKQRSWLTSCIRQESVKRHRTENSRRQVSYEYFITCCEKRRKVCQQFLLKTLNVSQSMIRYAVSQKNSLNTKRIYRPHNKSDKEKIKILKNYIEQLPAVPSHYCRNKSNKLYVPNEFRNISTLYKCYMQYLQQENLTNSSLSLRVFRKVFNNDFHIGFHLPKKDRCSICDERKNSDSSHSATQEFKTHLMDNDQVKEIFLKEQKQGMENSLFLCASFDLQKVLNTPHSKNITLFYSRKYAYYNLSIYENVTRNGLCFVWGEKDGKRGCNEICTAVYKYLVILDERKTVKELTLYCDSCAGQNRNKAMLAMIAFFIKSSTCIKYIKITYLLPGHTMMPVDSIHSTIESFTRNRTVWAPSEWPTVIRSARTNPCCYECISLKHSDFLNWKLFSDTLLPKNIKLKISTMRSAVFEENNITIKYGYFENSDTKTIKTDLNTSANSGPTLLYAREINISSNKFNDLKALCNKTSIPKNFHNEYLTLKHSQNIKDALNETDEEDV